MVEILIRSTIDYIYERIGIVELDNIFHSYLNEDKLIRKEKAHMLLTSFSDILKACQGDELYYYFLSFLIYATHDITPYKQFVKICISDDNLTKENRYYLYLYAMELDFLGIISGDTESRELLDDLYKIIFNAFDAEIENSYTFIEKDDRNKDLVIVLTGQVLELMHGPTKTLLDRCSVIKKCFGKNVLVVNTAELTRISGEVPLFNAKQGAYKEEYNEISEINYRGDVFQFVQCPNIMPDELIINQIVDMVAEQKPYCLVCIGGNSIVNDICSKIVPTIVISTVPSSRTQTYGQFQAIGRKVNKEDLKWAQKNGLSNDHFIESIFTSSFKSQTHSYNRKELNLPENGFIVVLVGGRLDAEIDEDCMNILLKLMNQGIYCAFMGVFDKFYDLQKKEDIFNKYAINLGFQEDALAVLECCDVYINPKRVGGGTSVAEALYKGLPVVTFDYGDGGLGAGEDFHVKNYDDMYEHVLRYKNDKNYYNIMVGKAKARATILTDSESEFVRIMKTAMERGL